MSSKFVRRFSPYRFIVYVPEQDEDMVKDFIELCRGRGTTASVEVLDFVRGQMPKLPEPIRADECGFCGKIVEELYDVRWASRRRIKACQKCFDEREKRGLVRTVIKRPGGATAIV